MSSWQSARDDITRRQGLGRLVGGIAAAGFATIGTTAPARAAVRAGTVEAVSGTAVAETDDGSRALAQAAPVFLDDLLRTGDESRLGVILGEATALRLGARARLRIDRYLVKAGTTLVLEGGPLLVDKQDPARNTLTIRSPYALIAVRGTKFFAGLLPDGFSVFVARGRVDVSAAGRRVSVRTGEGTTIATVGARPDPAKVWGDAKIRLALGLVN